MTGETRKQAAVAFLQLASSGDVERAYATYIAPNFRHHNPYFPGDAASLAQAMKENATQFPNKLFEPLQVIEEGDRVVVFGRVRMTPDSPPIALVHIFRFEGNQVAELWDVGQPLPENSPNEYGMF